MVWSTCSLQNWKDYVYFIWPSAFRLQVISGTHLSHVVLCFRHEMLAYRFFLVGSVYYSQFLTLILN